MVSQVSVCNEALQNLGANQITSITENTVEAIECNLRYDTARQTLLAMHPWNFAIRRAALNASVTAPAFNYSYAFTLPSDFLGLVMSGQEEQYQSPFPQAFNSPLYTSDVVNYGGIDKYRIERHSDGNLSLLSNESAVNIIYIADVDEEQKFSPLFLHLLARLLSAFIANKVTGSTTERNTQMELFKAEFADFVSLDSQQGVFDRLEVSQFLSARL